MLDQPREDGPTEDAPSGAGSATLRAALRRARAEAAERTDVVMDLRAAEIARLDILKDALDPVFAEVPDEIDIFDVGLAPGDRPRLFVDMVAFVEMGHDRRTYRFMRDGRRGRACVAESAEVGPIVEAVTAYVARRLVERERLLVDDERSATPDREPEVARAMAQATSREAAPAAPVSEAAPAPAAKQTAKPTGGRFLRVVAILFAFGVGAGLGAILVAALIVAAAKGLLPI